LILVKAALLCEVHSALSSFNYIEGDFDSIIKALISVVGDSGSIIMLFFLLSKPVTLTRNI